MITKTITVKGGEFVVEAEGRLRPVETYYGLRDDTKPIAGVNNGDRYLEMDTGDVYLFDESGKRWWSV